MDNTKLSYQELKEQIADLKKENDFFRLHSSFKNHKNTKGDKLASPYESEQYFNSIINKIGDPVFVKNNESRFVFVNDAFCEIFNLTSKEILEKTLAEDIPPEEMEVFLQYDKQVLNTGIENINEETLTIRGGQTKIISTRKSRFIDSDGNKFIVGIIHDITKLKNAEKSVKISEAHFRGLFNQSHISTALVGLDKCFVKCNEAFCNFLGYPEKELIGKKIADFTFPDDKDLGVPEMKKIVQGEMESALVQKRYIRKDGSIVWGELTISVVRDEHNKPLYFLPVIQDITERSIAEKKLKDSKNKLKELNSTKDKLFSIIAHDLRGPFNSIEGFSDLIMNNLGRFNQVELKKYLGLINTSANNSINLLDNLLNWAKSQTDQIVFSPKKINITAIIGEILNLLEPTALVKNITLKQRQSEPIKCFADENMTRVVIRNLISNAIKFTNENGEIIVTQKTIKKEIEITVSDNGVGIKKEIIKEIFDVSKNKSTLGTANEKGSGLGLLLCKEFVRKNCGEIWVESIEGKGSDFKFTLPII